MERSRNVEDLHHLRLMALLHELVRERDLKGAAEALGLDPRTLSASMERGALSGLAQVALERWLLAEGDREAARCREEVQELAGRVDGVEQRVDGLAGEVGQGRGGGPAGCRGSRRERHRGAWPGSCSGWSGGWTGWNQRAGLAPDGPVVHRRRGLGAMPGWVTRSIASIPTW